jgi:cobalt-precorrin-5B (C1)-methyltransferase
VQSSSPRAGYTLPVFACAAAVAALKYLCHPQSITSIPIDLLEPAQIATIGVEQVAPLPDGSVLAITRSDPGDNLDLTHNTPIWAVVKWAEPCQDEQISLEGGDGIGRITGNNKAAIYTYALRLLMTNLQRVLAADQKITVTLIMPAGKALAERTSNAAFGVVEGLSLLGTTGISQPLSSPGQLEAFRQTLKTQADQFDPLVFCIGENGLDLAIHMGLQPARLIKTANWLGPLLVEASVQGITKILLFGYHGKLLKLAGSIFHTHHHIADARLEILMAHCANQGLPLPELKVIFTSATAEAAFQYLKTIDEQSNQNWVKQIYEAIALTIDQRTQTYIHKLSGNHLIIGSVLFDRSRQIITASETGKSLLKQCQNA